MALLETNDDEFISAQNISIYEKDLNNIYNMLVEEISCYEFDNIEEKNTINLEIQAMDLDRIDIGSLKVMLINYFKYCLSRSNLYYELNPNLLQESFDEFDLNKLTEKLGQDLSIFKFLNLSNLNIKTLSFVSGLENLQVLIVGYNNLTNLVDL